MNRPALRPTQRPPIIVPVLVLTVGIGMASTAAILIEVGHDRFGAATLVLAAGRLALATVLLSALVAARRSTRQALRNARPRDVAKAVGSGMLLALHFAAWFASLAYTSVASSVTLVCTSPVFVALGAAVLLRERLPRAAFVGIALAVVGSVGIGLADADTTLASRGRDPLVGNVLALLGAVAIAGYLLIGRDVRQRMALLPYVWLTYASAAVVLVAWSLLAGSAAAWLALPPEVWGILVALAVGPQLIGHTSLNWAVRYLPATVVAVAVLGEPIGSALLAWWLLGQPVTLGQGLAAAVLLGGIAWVSRAMALPRQSPAPSPSPLP